MEIAKPSLSHFKYSWSKLYYNWAGTSHSSTSSIAMVVLPCTQVVNVQNCFTKIWVQDHSNSTDHFHDVLNYLLQTDAFPGSNYLLVLYSVHGSSYALHKHIVKPEIMTPHFLKESSIPPFPKFTVFSQNAQNLWIIKNSA